MKQWNKKSAQWKRCLQDMQMDSWLQVLCGLS